VGIGVDVSLAPTNHLQISPVSPNSNIFEYVTKKGTKILFRFLTVGDEQELGLISRNLAASKVADTPIINSLIKQIISVNGDDKIVRDYVTSLSAMEGREVKKFMFNSQPDILLRTNFTCSECGNLNENVRFGLDYKFFWRE